MHLGNARTALLAWLAVRNAGGAMVLRVEDLDHGRVVPGAEAQLCDELRWLGLDWDEGPDCGPVGPFGPYRQSERAALYDAAIDRLLASRHAFPCARSRADVARAASAPHENRGDDEDGPRYPGTCSSLSPAEVHARVRAHGRSMPVIRFSGEAARIAFHDQVHGDMEPFGAAGVDDFVLRRADGTAAYQLAVVVDDAAMQVTHVMRGDDLLRSTPRQIALFRALSAPPPRFAHVPLVRATGGERLAKRAHPLALADLRRAGVAPETIVGALAASAGLCPPGARAQPRELIAAFDLDRLPRAPVAIADLAPGPPSQ